jgi:hypothetical protein
MKWGSGGIAPRFLWPSHNMKWSASRPARFTPRERAPSTHWVGGWVGLRSGLDAVVKRKFPAPVGTRTPDHPARSPALYHWAIPAHAVHTHTHSNTQENYLTSLFASFHGPMARQSEARVISDRFDTGFCGLESLLRHGLCLHFCLFCRPVSVDSLRWVHPHSKETYKKNGFFVPEVHSEQEQARRSYP